MSRVALLGGSFNPPHVAHQMVVLWALSTGRADRVWLVPCHRHPFGKELSAFEERFRMCELAVEGLYAPGRVTVSRVEQELGGESRTLDTVQHLVEEHPEHGLALIIGADILAEKASWYRFDAIERLVDLIVVGRAGHDGAGEHAVVLPDVSSTEIRRRLRAGEPVDHLVPAPVLAHIQDRGLYRG